MMRSTVWTTDSESLSLGTLNLTCMSAFSLCGARVRITASVMSLSSNVRHLRSQRHRRSSPLHEASSCRAVESSPRGEPLAEKCRGVVAIKVGDKITPGAFLDFQLCARMVNLFPVQFLATTF